MLVTLPSPIPELQHALLPQNVANQGGCLNSLPFSIVLSLDSHLGALKSLGCVSHLTILALHQVPLASTILTLLATSTPHDTFG